MCVDNFKHGEDTKLWHTSSDSCHVCHTARCSGPPHTPRCFTFHTNSENLALFFNSALVPFPFFLSISVSQSSSVLYASHFLRFLCLFSLYLRLLFSSLFLSYSLFNASSTYFFSNVIYSLVNSFVRCQQQIFYISIGKFSLVFLRYVVFFFCFFFFILIFYHFVYNTRGHVTVSRSRVRRPSNQSHAAPASEASVTLQYQSQQLQLFQTLLRLFSRYM